MESSRPIHLLLACDDGMFDGLVLSVASALLHLDDQAGPVIHLFDAGISTEHLEVLTEMVSTVHSRGRIVTYEVDLEPFEGLKPLNGSLATYARLLAPKLISEERVLYLDCDLYIGRDLAFLYDEVMTFPLAGAVDMNMVSGGHASKEEGALFQKISEGLPSVYINMGVLLMDLDRLRDLNFTQWCIQTGRMYSDLLSYNDQTLINAFASLQGVQPISSVWNMPQYRWDLPSCCVGHDVVLHFMGYQNGKPWTVFRKSSSYELARSFYAHIGYELDVNGMKDRYRFFQKMGNPVRFVYLIVKHGLQAWMGLLGVQATWSALRSAMEQYEIFYQDVPGRTSDVKAAIASWREVSRRDVGS